MCCIKRYNPACYMLNSCHVLEPSVHALFIINVHVLHKQWDDSVRLYYELEMCHDIKTGVKYNTGNVHVKWPQCC